VISHDYNNKTFSSFRNSYLKPDISDNDIKPGSNLGSPQGPFAFFGKEIKCIRNREISKSLLTANNDDIVVIID